jgi:hypothetical protein
MWNIYNFNMKWNFLVILSEWRSILRELSLIRNGIDGIDRSLLQVLSKFITTLRRNSEVFVRIDKSWTYSSANQDFHKKQVHILSHDYIYISLLLATCFGFLQKPMYKAVNWYKCISVFHRAFFNSIIDNTNTPEF